ncbi:hypothetical protein [Corynebacterium matruchotii]|uniref:hypothetical protein n=1 Tax=Corynebacterium matruchotii TaxID=43768 RepID=UPI0028E7958C|nr:hypothetical protein [Corynebacterium matruchotii]
MTVPDAVSNLFVESLKLSAKQRTVLDVINEHPRGITAARIATIMGTTVNTLRGHLDELLAQDAIRAEAPNVGSRGRPALVYYSRVPDNRAIALEYITLVRVFAQYLLETTDDPRAAAYDIGRTWAREIATEPCDESELLVRLAQMGFDPVPVEEPHNLADAQLAAPLAEQPNAHSIPKRRRRQRWQMGPPQAAPTPLAARSLNCGPAHSCTRTRTLPPPCATFTWVCLPPERAPTDGVSRSRRIMVMSSAT